MRHVSSLRYGLGVMLVLLSVTVSYAQDALRVLSQVSDGADAVLVIPSLRQLSDKVVLMSGQLGLGAQMPPDPMMMLKAMSGMMMGVDEKANVAVVLSNLDNVTKGHGMAKPNVAMLLPVTTLDAFMGNFANRAQKLDNGLTQVQAMGGQQILIKPLGDKYVLLSDSQDSLLTYKPANADHWTSPVGVIASDYMTKGDLIMLFNPKTLGKMLNDNMAEIRADIKKGLDDEALAEFRP